MQLLSNSQIYPYITYLLLSIDEIIWRYSSEFYDRKAPNDLEPASTISIPQRVFMTAPVVEHHSTRVQPNSIVAVVGLLSLMVSTLPCAGVSILNCAIMNSDSWCG